MNWGGIKKKKRMRRNSENERRKRKKVVRTLANRDVTHSKRFCWKTLRPPVEKCKLTNKNKTNTES